MIRTFFLAVAAILGTITAADIELNFNGIPEDAIPSAMLKAGEMAYETNQRGLAALEAGQIDSALVLFRRALEQLPGYTDAQNNIGVAHFRRGTVFRARELWLKITQNDPEYAIAWYNLGLVAFHDGNYDEASEMLRTALRRNKRFFQALVMLARIDLTRDEPRRAMGWLRKAYRINPDHPGVWPAYAYGLIMTGDTTDAQRVLGQHLDDFRALEMLGQIAAVQRRLGDASQYLKRAVQGGASDSVLVDLAAVLLDSGLCREALSTLDHYHGKKSVPSADGFILGGVAARECGEMGQAQAFFERGVGRYPSNPILRFNLGQIHFYNADYARAQEVWKPLADTLDDPVLYHLRSLAAFRQEQWDEAEKHIRRAIELDGKAEYFDLLGVVLHKLGRKNEAIDSFKEALKIAPGHRSAELNLTLVSGEGKLPDLALEEMRDRLSQCNQNCAQAALELSVFHYHRGQFEQAVRVLESVPERRRSEKLLRHLAIYYRAQGRLTRAVSILEHARENFVLQPETEQELVDCYLQAGLYAKATGLLEKLIGEATRNPWRLYYQMGYAYLELNDLRRAREYFERSLHVKKSNMAARGLLAFVYNREGNLGKAQELWRKNLRNDPDNPVLWINMGLAAEREGEYEKALEYYEKARRLRPGDKGLMINIGNAYMALERNRQAHEAYASALGSSKKEIAAYNIFVLALKERKHERAREMNELLRKHFPRSLYARRAEGELALWDGDTARALRTLEGLEKKNDNDWYTLARIYVAKGRKSEARRAMDQLPGDPVWVRMRRELEAQQAFTTADFGTAYEIWNSMADTSLSIQYNMALAALKDRQYKTAMALGQKLVRRADGSIRSDLCRLIGNAAFGLKQWDEARSWYMQLAGLKSDDPLVQYNLAVAAYNLGAIEEAWEHYQRARELDERITNRDIEKRYRALKQGSAATTRIEPIDSLYNVAVELQNSGSDTAAEALYHSIIQKDSTYHLAWNNLGALLAARGDLEQALDCYRKAVERNYGLVEGYANLVNIYMAMGDFSQARRWLLKGKGHNPDSDLLKEMEKHLSDSAEQHSQQQR